jgi:hypothetical protein
VLEAETIKERKLRDPFERIVTNARQLTMAPPLDLRKPMVEAGLMISCAAPTASPYKILPCTCPHTFARNVISSTPTVRHSILLHTVTRDSDRHGYELAPVAHPLRVAGTPVDQDGR